MICSKAKARPRDGSLSSLRHHHLDELFVIDLSVTIDVRLADHLIHLFISKFLAKVCHDVAQLCRADEAITIAIKHLEGFDQLLLSVRVFHLARHQGQKLWKVDRAVSVSVDLVYHVLELSLGGVLPQ